ncbi:MAG TPA: hypothetical protein VLC54_00230 [Anaeromyxobacter sp.]|nr:hypothetical protein [Anaeromyxobacter sp.]
MGCVSVEVGFVSVVDLSSGVVSDYRPNVPTLDFPAALRADASEVSLDGIGLVHFSGSDGCGVTERTRSSPVSMRRQDERCFILADAEDRDEHGWQIYRLCMLEPSA